MGEQLPEFDYEKANEILRHSWQVHRRAFGPILEPAFAENPAVRVRLTAALNHLSRREVKPALAILKGLKRECRCNADLAAWYFFVGLCFEMGGVTEQMVSFYRKAAAVGHRFYLPFLKTARYEHLRAEFALAEQSYRSGIDCLLETDEAERDNAVLASAYINLCSCLTMMHRYPEAQQMLAKASELPAQPAGAATAAVLCAVLGDREKTEFCMTQLRAVRPDLVEQIGGMTQKILAGEHAHFSPVPFEAQGMAYFWQWFEQQQEGLKKLPPQDCVSLVAAQIQKVFPFMEREPRLTVGPLDDKWEIVFYDMYSAALNFGYLRLLAARPAALKEEWKFRIVH